MGREEKVICTNKKAYYNYLIEETIEAGICLLGGEVKSLREGRASINEAFGRIEKGECFLYNSHISQYPQGLSYDEKRKRKLLLHKYQIKRLLGKLQEKRMCLVPIRLYFKNKRVKVELGLGRGRRLIDKREVIKKREIEREIQKALKN